MSTSLPTSTTLPPATHAVAQLPDPRTSQPVLPAGTLSLVPETSLSMATGASPSAIGVMSNAELTAAVLDLGKMVAGIHAFLLGPQGPQPIPPPPLTQQQLPPPPLPAWIAGLSKPIYTAPSTQPHLPPLPTTGAVMAHGGAPAPGVLYGGVDGPLFHGGSLMPTLSVALAGQTGAAPSAAA